jgi:hypothetical protein
MLSEVFCDCWHEVVKELVFKSSAVIRTFPWLS